MVSPEEVVKQLTRRMMPYKNPNRDKTMISSQRLDRYVRAVIRKGVKTSTQLLDILREYEAKDLRFSIERLISNKKIKINSVGEFEYIGSM